MLLSVTKQRIAVSLRIVTANNYNENRDAISHDWISFLEKINAYPILIPNSLSNTKSFLENLEIDGIILSGGDNIGDNLERDQTEIELIEFGISKKIPIFGVCRGMQVLNQYFGGSVKTLDTKKHVGKPHSINIIHKKFDFLNKDNFKVNSFHNNVIEKENIGKNLQSFAIMEDKTIEGFFHNEFLITGVMWHPEREQNLENLTMLNQIFTNTVFRTN